MRNYLDASMSVMKSSGKKRSTNQDTTFDMMRGLGDDSSAIVSTSFETGVGQSNSFLGRRNQSK